jgi:CRISPR/Cas system-associated endoribonuclease Cas2
MEIGLNCSVGKKIAALDQQLQGIYQSSVFICEMDPRAQVLHIFKEHLVCLKSKHLHKYFSGT